ncbi:hypothetical protein [Ramlibacter sp.]|uniref:hypothetical protein n=1 Tax=Ramlibacter sp. TaxID=1917967 RepID=UPI0017C7684F|nr:hypothetical protein [Ramlibacter sp.]MBA2674576.1 hypothetical protein [Ramlibacter sp.]
MPDEVPTPEPNPLNNPDPQPGDGKPKAPPSTEDESGPQAPIELPGKSNPPERV